LYNSDFDLEKERSGLDEQGLKIAENQETSQKNRRRLAENTRDFRKASPDDKLSLFNSLLKSYQEEVDNITKRAKFGENAFLNIYQKLYEAPDPYPALASMAVCHSSSILCHSCLICNCLMP
jgi:homeobox protein cut-like